MTRKLHVGGQVAAAQWEIIDAVPGPLVDHVGNAGDLSRFGEGSFSELYASHVLEHFDYNGELQAALKEWWRVLVPGGVVYISVPDLEVLARLFLSPDLPADGRFFIMRMIFGGHVDRYDYHVVGLNQEFLDSFLREAGFVNIRKVESFGLFADTSEMKFNGTPISLNVIAEKPKNKPLGQSFDWQSSAYTPGTVTGG